jgi:hypothetical protein
MSRFRQLERARKEAQGEADKKRKPYMILDVLGEYWVRKFDEHKRDHILGRYPNAEFVVRVEPRPDLFGHWEES